jgi:hypothetical protein
MKVRGFIIPLSMKPALDIIDRYYWFYVSAMHVVCPSVNLFLFWSDNIDNQSKKNLVWPTAINPSAHIQSRISIHRSNLITNPHFFNSSFLKFVSAFGDIFGHIFISI